MGLLEANTGQLNCGPSISPQPSSEQFNGLDSFSPPLVIGPASSGVLPVTNSVVSESISSSFVSTSDMVVSLPAGTSGSNVRRRHGKGSYGGRGGFGRISMGCGGLGRGGSVPGVFSASRRFLQFARGKGKRIRSVPPVPVLIAPSSAGGLVLHVDLPNLNTLPVDDPGREASEM